MTLESILSKLEKLEKEVSDIKTQNNLLVTKVIWNEKVTDSGIQLQGSDFVQKSGIIIGAQFLPTSSQEMKMFFIVKKDITQEVGLVPAEGCKVEQ